MTTSPTLDPSYDDSALRAVVESCGARHAEDPHGPQALFDTQTVAPAELLESGALMLLADWGVVSVSGTDAVRFLHGQTTNDVEGQPADTARWHGYCSPKGRLLAGGLLWRDGAELRFAVSRPLARARRSPMTSSDMVATYRERQEAVPGRRAQRHTIWGL